MKSVKGWEVGEHKGRRSRKSEENYGNLKKGSAGM